MRLQDVIFQGLLLMIAGWLAFTYWNKWRELKRNQVPKGDPRYVRLATSILLGILMVLIAYARLHGH